MILSAFLNLLFVNTDTNLLTAFKTVFAPSGRSSESVSSGEILMISSETDFIVSAVPSAESSFSFCSFPLFILPIIFQLLMQLPKSYLILGFFNQFLLHFLAFYCQIFLFLGLLLTPYFLFFTRKNNVSNFEDNFILFFKLSSLMSHF